MGEIVKISGLTVSYPTGFNKTRTVIDNLNLKLESGLILGLLGPNGAGKTTLIKSMLGLLRSRKGEISLFGDTGLSARTKARLGYMPEVARYYWFMTPAEILRMFGGFCGLRGADLKSRMDRTLEIVGLAKEQDKLVRTFSKGMQERLSIAQAILHDPEFLILDEPFSGLDPLGRIHIRGILKDLRLQNKTILLSSHELSEAELICDRICIMKAGRILKDGPMHELLTGKENRTLEGYFVDIIGSDDA